MNGVALSAAAAQHSPEVERSVAQARSLGDVMDHLRRWAALVVERNLKAGSPREQTVSVEDYLVRVHAVQVDKEIRFRQMLEFFAKPMAETGA